MASDNYDKLSTLGTNQAQWLGEYFKQRQLSFGHVFSGDMLRQRQTAEAIGQAITNQSLKHTCLPGLNEFDFEDVVTCYLEQHPENKPSAGSDAKVYFKLLKQAVQAWQQHQLTSRPQESWQQFSARVAQALNQVTPTSNQPVLVVTSGGVIATLLKHILKLDDNQVMALNLQIANTSVTQLRATPRRHQLSQF